MDIDTSGIRWGLCCLFSDRQPHFRQATAAYMNRLGEERAHRYLADVAGANVIALWHALERCHELGICAFRINSQMLPLATHPVWGYNVVDLPGGSVIEAGLRASADLAVEYGISLSVHPDQYNVLNSETERVVAATIIEIEQQAWFCEAVGASTICLHGGSKAGGIAAAQERLRGGIERLSDRARSRLALENDDRSYTVADLLPVCTEMEIPLIYDVHHHRCNPDDLNVEAATDLALTTWCARATLPLMHLSSPRIPWGEGDPRPHADFVDPLDIPRCWSGINAIVDVEAKAKERAVMELYRMNAEHLL